MNSLRLVFVVLATFGLEACGNITSSSARTDGQAQLVQGESSAAAAIVGTAPQAAENKTVYARYVPKTGSVVPLGTTTVSSSVFTVALPDGLGSVASGNIAVFIDINGDGICNIAPTDVGGTCVLASGGNATLALSSASQAPCTMFGDFSLTIGGTDFFPHNNENIYAAVRDTASNAYVTTPMGQKVSNGVWQVTFVNALVKGRAYAVDYFADIAGDKQCQDHSWTKAVGTAAQTTTVNVSHDTAQTPVCTSFPSMMLATP